MLISTVFLLRPTADALLPMTLGNAWYTAFLEMVGQHDRDLAAQLHDPQGLKPFTTSPLQGPVSVRDRQVLVQRQQDYWLRITSIEPHLSRLLAVLAEQPPQALRLHSGHFTVQRVTSDPQVHPWAAHLPYEALYTEALQHPERSRPQVTMVFESPTAFRSQGRNILFPLPRSVFGSLMNRWKAYAPLVLDSELLDALDASIDIERYTLKTQMQNFGRYQLQAGFVGECTYGARKGVAREVTWGLRLLAAFAFFAGVGYRTTMGMGQVRVAG